MKSLGACDLPSLERLVLSLSSDADPCAASAVARALLGLRAPKLHEVHIDGVDDVGALLALLAAGPQLTGMVLTVSGTVDDEERLLETLTKNASWLRALEVLGLPLGDEVSSDGDEAIRALLPTTRDSSEWGDLTLPAAYESWST